MMTQQEAEAIYDAGKETVVRVLLKLSRKVDMLTADFTVLRTEAQVLRDRVQTLERQIAKNSRNSSKPPSSDGFKKPAPKSLRIKGQRKSGGQLGHIGHTFMMAEKPDQIEVHSVDVCEHCHRSLSDQEPDGAEKRQVHDLPLKRLIVTEHQVEIITQAKVAHFDETGARVETKLWWLHSASTENATYYDIHRKRGSDATAAIGILPDFVGRAIHDFWVPYFNYSCLHGLCNAHHLRELIFVHEQHHQKWADHMIDCLLDIKDTVSLFKQTQDQLPEKQILIFEALYQKILNEGYAQNQLPPRPLREKKKRGRRKKSKPRNLLERLDKHRREALAFMHDFSVPFDNNQAERDIRMMKIQQKISGAFRTEEGARAFCRIRSYISTARKNSIGAMDTLTRLFSGIPFVPDLNTT